MSDLFNSLDADLIIQSCDGKQFRVYRHVLSDASPLFKLLLSLPQPATTAAGGCLETCPVIGVQEDAQTVSTLLRLVYPVPEPVINSLDELATVLNIADKYVMDHAIEVLRRLLVSPQYLKESPTRVYAIACQHDLDEEARIASESTLAVNVKESLTSEDLDVISVYSKSRLLELHESRSKAALELVRKTTRNIARCVQCDSNFFGSVCPPKWWYDYERRARAELQLRPTSNVICSMEFLSVSAQNGSSCRCCERSIQKSYELFAGLKSRIDALPSTI